MPIGGNGGQFSSRTLHRERPASLVTAPSIEGQRLLLRQSETATATFTAPISGGAQTGGSAATSRVAASVSFAYSPTGGIQTSGTAITSRLAVRTFASSGGVQSGGSATIARRIVRTVILTGGSIQTGGTAPRALVQDVAPLGGLQIAGTAPVSRVRVSQASGGILTGGSALKAFTKAPTASGGLLTGGAAFTSRQAVGGTVYTYLPTGGIVLGGSAPTALIKPAVGGGRSRIQYLETIRSFEEPKRKAGKPSGELVDEFLAKSRAYRGRGKVKVGSATFGKVSRRSATLFVPAATLAAQWATLEPQSARFGNVVVRSYPPSATLAARLQNGTLPSSVKIGGEAVTYRHDPFLLARFEDLDLLMMG